MNDVYHTYYRSPLGILKICATTQYITEITFIDDETNLEPASEITPLLAAAVEQLIEYFNGERRFFDIAVHQNGTVFQSRVWNELIGIQFGKTISYMDLAKKLGDPKAIRAAASTNGKNQLCIVVPCHRVIGTDRGLVGYAGGLWRKKWLLSHENKIANGVQTLF
ncbi:methylated-DNA--[protein]-cysteine S-methyltransferase [Segetibacter sp. 3557_3]|uniref:methylated-DNA--[protein]-cysteine S-methyltransferase n=1 Tax=Segetibacter sp. 3557_3 TaxID=2547429 RepID=UPI0010585E05|nr:methylated-DNA--[protein]-cysteine S-methyltransferase [Segetibacter sp. 3557_3]TDH27503.1 methylated-DNA--[protein]-cysteine S-methyltransferase [Segetibacter sp. 3557_3]